MACALVDGLRRLCRLDLAVRDVRDVPRFRDAPILTIVPDGPVARAALTGASGALTVSAPLTVKSNRVKNRVRPWRGGRRPNMAGVFVADLSSFAARKLAVVALLSPRGPRDPAPTG